MTVYRERYIPACMELLWFGETAKGMEYAMYLCMNASKYVSIYTNMVARTYWF